MGWRERCAERLTRTLTRTSRSAKTRAYLATLPSDRPRVVSPAEFGKRVVVVSHPAPLPEPPAARGMRKRPSARTKWNCRPHGRLRFEGRRLVNRTPFTITQAAERWAKLMAAQDGRCGLCGEILDDPKPSVDHVVPLFHGGYDGFGNYLAAHGHCNGEKTNDYPTGCELVWLLAVNARLGVEPRRW